MSVTKTATPVEQNVPQEAQNQPPASYLDVVMAEDPAIAFGEISDNDEVVSEFLQSAETDLAQAGAELELRLHTRKEKKKFIESLTNYETFLGLVAIDQAEKLLANGTSEAKLKHSVVNTIIESNVDVMDEDVRYRLEDSIIERTKEKIARGKVRRVVGRVALAGAEVGTAYLAWKGVFGSNIEEATRTEPMYVLLGIAGGHYGTRLAGEKFRDRVMTGIDKYRPKSRRKTENSTAAKPESENKEIAACTNLLNSIEKDLYVVTGQTFMDEGVDAKTLVANLIDVVDSWFKEFYQITNKKGQIGTGVAKSAVAALLDGVADIDLGDEGAADDFTDSFRAAVERAKE